MTKQSLTLTLALLLAGPTPAREVDLRGPAPQPGHTLILTADSETDEGELKGSMMGEDIEGVVKVKTHYVIQLSVLEVDELGPTRVRQKYAESVTVSEMTREGDDNTQKSEQRELEGATLTLTRDGKDWEAQLEADEEEDDELGRPRRGEMQQFLESVTYIDPRLAYPEAPVAVGATWTVRDEEVAAILGNMSLMPGGEYDGSIKCELVEVSEINGRRIAVISYDADIDITNVMGQGGGEMEATFYLKGKGLIERDLTDFTNANVFEGEMKFELKQEVDGRTMGRMGVEMPIKAQITQRLKQ